MEWYYYYLIVGIYVALCLYGSSIHYKITHKDYVRINPLLTRNILWQFPLAILMWWFIILSASYDTMAHSHLRQEVHKKKSIGEIIIDNKMNGGK